MSVKSPLELIGFPPRQQLAADKRGYQPDYDRKLIGLMTPPGGFSSRYVECKLGTYARLAGKAPGGSENLVV